jgi:hypothetical protein
MIKITRVQTRPNSSINFFTPRQEKVAYTSNTFQKTGKLIISNSVSEEGLTRTSIWIWVDQESLDLYKSNELVQLVKQEELDYINSNNFTLTETEENI